MYSRRFVYALGLCVCLLYLPTNSLLAQSTIEDPFITATSGTNYPMYFLFGEVGASNNPNASGSIRSVQSDGRFSLIYADGVDSFSNLSNTSVLFSEVLLRTVILKHLKKENYILGFEPLSTYDPGSASNVYLCQTAHSLDILTSGLDTSDVQYAPIMRLNFRAMVRTVNPDSTVNINSQDTSLFTKFDLFYFAYLDPVYKENDIFFAGTLIKQNNGQLNTSFYNRTRINYTETPYFLGSFRFDLDGNVSTIEAGRYGIPFVAASHDQIDFCNWFNGYWSYGSASNYVTFPWIFPDFRSLVRPLSSTLHFVTNSERLDINGVSSDVHLISGNFSDLDSDSGGMTDYHEWYQTKHDLLDPSDDRYTTPEIEVPPEDLPEPPEGESVVDIGKDTVGRYENYWDNQVGDPFDLDNIEQPETSDPDNFELEHWDVESIYQTTKGSTDTSKLENAVEDVFGSVDNVQDISLSFTPTVDMSSLGVTWQGQTIDLNPVHVLGLNTRAVSDVAIKFRMIRLALLLVEWITFFYACYKLVLNSISGSSDGGSEE